MRRKRYHRLVALLFTILFGGALGYLVFAVPPVGLERIVVFFLLVFVTAFWLGTCALISYRRGLLIAIGVTAVGLLRLFRMENILTVILLVALLLTVEVYYSR